MNTFKASLWWKKPLWMGILVFLVLLLLTQFVAYQRYQLLRTNENRELAAEANNVEERLQNALNDALHTVQTLAFIMQNYGVPENFDSIAKRLLEANRFIDALQLVNPNGFITHTYPLQGNEAAIGYNILEDSIKHIGAQTAIATKQFFWGGPVELKQGGAAIIGRQPVFKNGKFFGFTAVIIRLNTLFEAAGIDTGRQSQFIYQLSRVDPKGGHEVYFLPMENIRNRSNGFPVEIPNGEWKLYVLRKSNVTFLFAASFSLLGLLLSVTGGLFAYNMGKQPQLLGQLVKEKTERLAVSEKYFRALIEHSTDAIVLVDEQGKVKYQSPSAERITGYSLDEMQHLDGLSLIHPEDRQSDYEAFAAFAKSPGALMHRNHRFKHKDGHYVWLEGSYTNLLHDESIRAIIYNYHDVTNRKQAEQKVEESEKKYRTTIERVSDAFVALDKDWCYTYMNAKAGSIFNRDPETIIGKHIWTEFPEGIGQPFYHAYHKAMETQQYTFLEEYYPPYDLWFENHIYPSPDGLSIYFKDVTERRKAQEEILRAYKEKETTLNRINDAVVSVDNEWRYTFLNDAAMLTHPAGRENTFGHVMWDVHPELKGTIFEEKYREAMRTGQVIEIEDYYAPMDTWFFVKVYPSSDGLTIFYKDITASKKAQQEIIREKNLSDSIINSLPGIFYMYNRSGKFIRCNKNFEKVSGYTWEEISQMHPLDFFDADEKELLRSKINEVFQQGVSDVEASFLTRSGQKVPYYFNGHLDHFDGSDYLIGVGIDITERQQARKALQESEEKYRLLFRNNPLPMWMLSLPSYNIIDVNDAAVAHYGYSKEEFLKLNARDLRPKEELERFEREMVQVEREGTEFTGLWIHKKKSGELLTAEVVTHDMRYDGQHLRIVLSTDVTEREQTQKVLRENESRLAEAQAVAKVGSWETNLVDLSVIWSRETYRIFELEPDAISTSHPGFLQFVHPEDREKVDKAFASSLLSKDIHSIEHRIVTAAGRLKHVEERWRIVHDENGKPEKAVGTCQDITERKKAEEALLRTTQELKERIKEQNCLYAVSALVNDSDKPIEDILQQCADIIPSGYQYPDITCVRITYKNDIYVSAPFCESAWKQEAEIVVQGKVTGHIEVFYTEIKPTEQDGPFLKEERILINSIAANIANAVERRMAEAAIRTSEENYRYLFNNNPAIIIIWDLETLEILEANEKAFESYGYSREEFLKMTVLDYRPAEDHQKIRAFASHMLTSDEPIYRAVWRHFKKSGEAMYMDISSHRIDYNNRKAILSLAEDITERLQVEGELKKTYEDIRRLNAHLQTIREEERTGIAREIHDELGQQLTGLKMDVSWLNKKINTAEPHVQERLTGMFTLIDDTVKTVRRISSDLRPGILDDLGLLAALEWQSSEFEKRTGIPCNILTELRDIKLEKHLATGVFRVYQEALTNVMRHASATQVTTTIEQIKGLLVLKVQDNGSGFDLNAVGDKKTLGIIGMKERALMFGGELEIESKEGKGTCIVLRVPLPTQHT